MSPSTNRNPGASSTGARLARLPSYVSLSRTTTERSGSRKSKRRTNADPMNPAPPVTRTRHARPAAIYGFTWLVSTRSASTASMPCAVANGSSWLKVAAKLVECSSDSIVPASIQSPLSS